MSEVQPAKPGPDLLKWAIRGAALIGVAAVLYVIVSASIKPDDGGYSKPAGADYFASLPERRRDALAQQDALKAERDKLSTDAAAEDAKVLAAGREKPAHPKLEQLERRIRLFNLPAKLEAPAAPGAMPTTAFTDADGKVLTLADFKGQVVVVNLWATWCVPCKLEMPTLAALQAAYQTQPLQVVAISVDRDTDLNLAKAQIAANAPLKLYRDPGYKFAFGMKPTVQGFPTTILFDKKGRERARLSGDADWNGQEARALVEALLKE